MPTELSELLGNERWIEVEIGGATFEVAYRPGSTSLRRQAEIQRQVRQMQAQTDMDEVAQAEQMGKLFCELVCGWDLEDGGQPLPLTVEVVAGRLPGPVFNAVMQAIGEDGRAQQKEKKALSATSDATYPPRGKRAKSPNGTRTSEPLDTWA
jgi:hypothetical protein